MKKIALLLLTAAMIVTLAVSASAFFEAEEAFGEVAFSIGKQTAAWNPDGTITDGEYFKVDIKPEWLSYAINDNDTDAGLAYAKATMPELYMSWDETYVYAATRYTVTEGHENLWDGDPASMWYSGAVQFNYANFDEVASEYRLEYGVGLSSDTSDTLYTVWADGVGNGYEPTQEDARVWLDGNTLTYETRVPWEAFADEDNTGYKEGNGFNTTFVWSIGKGQDYVHIQLAEGCTGAGKHAENMAQVTLVGAVAAPMTESFPVEKAETAPVLDGVVDEGEYELITAYSKDSLDWFISDYGPALQTAADGLPDYQIDVYGAWDEKGVYVAVVTDCDDHIANTDPVWNGSGVMIGFVPESPDADENAGFSGYDAMGSVLQEIAYSYSDDGEINLNNTTNDAIMDENVFTTYNHADGKDIYEMLFTWDFIGGEPELDREFGLGLMISKNNDNAADGIDWVCFQSDIVNGKIPDTYTKLVLKDDKTAAPTYTYPVSGAGDNIITGTVIGNETGWGGSETAGRAAAFDGDPATFFDPLGVGDGFCGIDAGESYILDKAVILSRDGFNDRFDGAKIQGSNDGENWVTLWTSEAQGTYPDYYTVTEFENNTGYKMFRYYNDKNHGDVAEVEFYGAPGKALPDVENYAIGATVTVTSTETDDFPGELAVDGDLGTRWASAYTDDEAITIDLGKAKNVNYVALYWETAMATDYEIYGSLDENNLEEKTLATVTGNAANDNVVEFDTEAVRYITIHSSKRATDWGNSLWEIVVSGEGDAEIPEASTADEKLDQKAEAPNTFDFGVVAAVAAMISLGGFAASRKRK